MKRYKIILIFGSLVLGSSIFSSCKKQLDEVVPQEQISTQLALTDPNATQTMYVGVYSRLRSQNGAIFNLGEMRSDIWADGMYIESADATAQQLWTHNISSTNVPYSSWANFYNFLYHVNTAMQVIPKSPVAEATKARWMGELYGIRAYTYYTLLRTWGTVPIITEPIGSISSPVETYKPRSSQDSVMMLIKSDIEKSLTYFGSSNTFQSGNRVFWNRVATLTLKGDVNIWSGTHLGGGNADFTTAKTALQEVKSLEGATLKLNTNYADNFDPLKKSNNPEIIMALNYELSQAGNGIGGIFTVNSVQATSYSFSPTGSPSVQTVYPYVSGANRVGMNQAMITRLTSGPADQRIAGSFKVMYSSASPFAVKGVFLHKWVGVVSGTSQVYNNDFPLYRYADVLLLLAEAKTKLGEDPSAEINQIRARAYGVAAPVFTNGSVTDNMNAILEEYLREFVGEGKRWFALRRAGDAYVYSAIKPVYLSPTTVAKFLLPISTGMMANDPLITQTPGY